MQKRLIGYSGVFALILAVVISCSSTKLTSSWKDRSYKGGYVKSVFIVGISKDSAIRKRFEESFAATFTRAGINSVASITVVPAGKELDKDIVKSAAKARSMETVLVTHLAASGEKKIYQPGPTGPSSRARYYGHYYPMVYGYTHSPGIYKKRKFVELVSNLYETASEKLIWTGVSESIDPQSAQEIIDSLVQQVIKDMRGNGLLK